VAAAEIMKEEINIMVKVKIIVLTQEVAITNQQKIILAQHIVIV
jgi:hypothetical protein